MRQEPGTKQSYAVPGCTRAGHACQTILACRVYAELDYLDGNTVRSRLTDQPMERETVR